MSVQLELEFIKKLAERATFITGSLEKRVELFLDHMSAQILGKSQTRTLFNVPAVADTNIFNAGDELKPKLLSSLWRCQIQLDAPGKVRLNTVVEGVKQTAGVLNDVALAAGIPKSFDFQSKFGATYNLEIDTTLTIEHLYIDEIPINA